MTTSTTTHLLGPSVHELLQAYNIHHTGHPDTEVEGLSNIRSLSVQPAPDTSLQAQAGGRQALQDGELTDQGYASRRRVPPYRATKRDHPLSSRPGGLNNAEAALVQAMFVGVYINAVRSPTKLSHEPDWS